MDPLHPVDPEKMPPQQPAAPPAPKCQDGEAQEVNQSASNDTIPPAAEVERIDIGAPDGQPTVDPASVDPESVASPANFQSPLATTRPSVSEGDTLPPANLDFESIDRPRELPAEPFETPAALAKTEPDPNAAPLDAPALPDISGLELTADRAASLDAWFISNTDRSAAPSPDSLLPVDVDQTVAPDSSTAIEPVADSSNSASRFEDVPGESVDRSLETPGESAVDCVKSLPSEPHPQPAEQPSETDTRAGFDVDQIFNDYSARTRALLSPAIDGGPPMARPIVLVSQSHEQSQRAVQEALAAAAARIGKTAAEVAEDKVHEALWIRDCEMRALMGGW